MNAVTYKRIIRVCVCCALLIGVASCSSDDKKGAINNVTGKWSFVGYLISNNCTQFSFLPLGAEFGLDLQLTQNQGDTRVTGQKTAGLLWAELPLSAGQVAGAYVNGEAVLDWQSTYIFPPFPFMTPAGAVSNCRMALNGQTQFFPLEDGTGSGAVVNTVSSSSGDCSPAWIQPLPCQMRVEGNWKKVN